MKGEDKSTMKEARKCISDHL